MRSVTRIDGRLPSHSLCAVSIGSGHPQVQIEVKRHLCSLAGARTSLISKAGRVLSHLQRDEACDALYGECFGALHEILVNSLPIAAFAG